MVKIEVVRRIPPATSRRRSEMASKWSMHPPVFSGAQYREHRTTDVDNKKRFLGGVTKLMYAAQQGDIGRVKKILKEQVSEHLIYVGSI